MSKLPRFNELILEELAKAVNREVAIPGGLVTVSYVECSPDLKQARVGFSVLPDKLAGTAGEELKRRTGELAVILKARTRLRRLPHLVWEFDATEREAEKIEKLIKEAQ